MWSSTSSVLHFSNRSELKTLKNRTVEAGSVFSILCSPLVVTKHGSTLKQLLKKFQVILTKYTKDPFFVLADDVSSPFVGKQIHV